LRDLPRRIDPATVAGMQRFWFFAFYVFGFPPAGGSSREHART
jgi:hypothetical protein